jgi:hypothetical protein
MGFEQNGNGTNFGPRGTGTLFASSISISPANFQSSSKSILILYHPGDRK